MGDLNPEIFEDLQTAERSRPLFEKAGLALHTWEAYCLAFNDRQLVRDEVSKLTAANGGAAVNPDVIARLSSLRAQLNPIVGELRKFMTAESPTVEERERQEMVLGFIAVSPTARELAARWTADPGRYAREAVQKLELIANLVERYRKALRASDAGETPVLPAPKSLEASTGAGEISLVWSAVPGAARYYIRRATSPVGPYTIIARPAQDWHADSELAAGVAYFYTVTAVAPDGTEGAAAGPAQAAPVTPLATPARLAAVPGHARVQLSWAAAAGAARYRLVRAFTPSGPFATVASTPDTSFTDTTVVNGTTYYYAVASANASGESPASALAEAMPVAPPPTPVGLAATPGNARVALAWTAVHGTESYSIRRAPSPDGPYVSVAGPPVPACTDAGVANGTTYYYTVSAINAGGESAPSAPVAVMPLGLPATPEGLAAQPAGGESADFPEVSATPQAPPGAASGLEIAAGNSQATLHWTPVEGAVRYSIKRAISREGPFTPLTTVEGIRHTDLGLTNGSTYYYAVAALNAGGEGPESPATAATPVAPPAAPTGVIASPAHREASITWAPSARASSYLVKRGVVPGGPYIDVATAVAPPHLDTGLTHGTAYYYVITAVNAGGESLASEEAMATPVDPPPAPSGVAATAGNTQVFIAWTAVPGASYYRIKRAGDRRGPYKTIANVTRVNYLDAGLENGKPSYYVLQAVNAGGAGPHSARVAITPIPPPPEPGGLLAIAGNGKVTLTWEAVPGATGYSLKRAPRKPGPYVTIQRLSQTSWVDTSVTNGTTYYYQVRAAVGAVKGPVSEEAQATPVFPPGIPGGVTAAAGAGMITLSWNPVAGATHYHVKRAATPSGPYDVVGSPESPAFEDVGLTGGTTYYYAISAENAGGESPIGLPVPAAPAIPPPVPTGLHAVAGDGDVALSWPGVSGAVRYTLKRGPQPEGPFVAIAEPSQTSHTDLDVENGTTYYYVVSAVSHHGESPDSFPAQARPSGPPPAPTGLTAVPGPSQASLLWTAVPSAERYRLLRSPAPGGPYTLVASPRDPTYTDCPLTNGVPCYYVVSAINAGSEGPRSAEVSAVPAAGPSPAEVSPARPAPDGDDDVPTLESIPMPSASKLQGIDLERLFDLRRVEQLRNVFEDTAQQFDEWEVLTLIAEEPYETRKMMELQLRLKNQGKADAFTSGAVALFERILKIRSQHGGFTRRLRAFLAGLDVPSPGRDVTEIAIGFILQAPRGRQRAEAWLQDPAQHRRQASEYMKMAYGIAEKYRAAL